MFKDVCSGEESKTDASKTVYDCADVPEMGVKYLDHITQQTWLDKFNEYDAEYKNNGWYTDGTPYDLSTITTKV